MSQRNSKWWAKAIGAFRSEPLVHFAIVGAAIFLAQQAWSPARMSDSSTQEIVISRFDQQRIAKLWELQWGRDPTPEEMSRLIADEVRQQVLYREALNLGLDKGDTIIRRRLVQKLQFLSEDVVDLTGPTDQQLRKFFDEQGDAYRIPARVTFSHVYFAPDGDADPYARARRELASLRAMEPTPIRAPERGDRILVRSDWSDVGTDELVREFGPVFASALTEMQQDVWHGPVTSGLGVHLVYLTSRREPENPVFGDVRDAVLADFLYARKQGRADKFYESLRSSYSIKVEQLNN